MKSNAERQKLYRDRKKARAHAEAHGLIPVTTNADLYIRERSAPAESPWDDEPGTGLSHWTELWVFDTAWHRLYASPKGFVPAEPEA